MAEQKATVLWQTLKEIVERIAQGDGYWHQSDDEMRWWTEELMPVQKRVYYQSPSVTVLGMARRTAAGIAVSELRVESGNYFARLGEPYATLAHQLIERVKNDRKVELLVNDSGVFSYQPTENDEHIGRFETTVRVVRQTGLQLKQIVDEEARRILDKYVPE